MTRRRLVVVGLVAGFMAIAGWRWAKVHGLMDLLFGLNFSQDCRGVDKNVCACDISSVGMSAYLSSTLYIRLDSDTWRDHTLPMTNFPPGSIRIREPSGLLCRGAAVSAHDVCLDRSEWSRKLCDRSDETDRFYVTHDVSICMALGIGVSQIEFEAKDVVRCDEMLVIYDSLLRPHYK